MLRGFKKGAFSVAVKAGVDVVPITLLGTGACMPSGEESSLRAGRVRIVVHAPIPTKGVSADEASRRARAAIAASMPQALVGDAGDVSSGED
eukprot:352542-Chlamydomonas_euryale.AAC.1